MRLPTCLSKSLIFPSASIDGAGWVTHTRINGDPVIRGHDLCFDRTCQRNRLVMCVGAGCKNGSNKLPSRGVMSHNEELSADQIRGLLFSLRWYMEFILQSRTRSLCSELILEYSEVEPTSQCRRQSTRWTHRHWSLVQGWYVSNVSNFLLFHAIVLPVLDVCGLYFIHYYHF